MRVPSCVAWQLLLQKLDHCAIFFVTAGERLTRAGVSPRLAGCACSLAWGDLFDGLFLRVWVCGMAPAGNATPLCLLALRKSRLLVLALAWSACAWGVVMVSNFTSQGATQCSRRVDAIRP
jgi:predicted membrane channel-forming protein YqfA (hemolysin III family)